VLILGAGNPSTVQQVSDDRIDSSRRIAIGDRLSQRRGFGENALLLLLEMEILSAQDFDAWRAAVWPASRR